MLLSGACSGAQNGRDGASASPTPVSLNTTAPASVASATATREPVAASCTLPVFTDEYIGFSVGVPAGWKIRYLQGVISVTGDAKGQSSAFAYPVRPATGTSPDTIVSGFISALNTALTPSGGSLSASGSKLTGVIAGTPVEGEVKTRTVGPDLVIYGGYGPSWGSQRATSLAVGECYQRKAAKSLQTITKTASTPSLGSLTMRFALPDGWQITGMTPQGIDLNLDADTWVGYSYLKVGSGSTTAEGVLQLLTNAIGLTGQRILATQDLGLAAEDQFTRWTTKVFELTGTVKGQQVHQVVTVITGNATAYGYTAGYTVLLSVRQTREADWEKLNAITSIVHESMVVTSVTEGSGLLMPRNNPLDNSAVISSYQYKSAVDAKLSRQREETILAFTNTKSPSTGDTYRTPNNAYNPTGPNGPGLYRQLPGGGQEKLLPANP